MPTATKRSSKLQFKKFADMPDDFKKLAAKNFRGPQKTPLKERVTVRLSPEVLTVLRESGNGWQTRLDTVLKKIVKRDPHVFTA